MNATTETTSKRTEFNESIGRTYLISNCMPVNSKRALLELSEILEKNQTNSFRGFEYFSDIDKLHAKSLMLFLIAQVYGQLASVDTLREFIELADQAKRIK